MDEFKNELSHSEMDHYVEVSEHAIANVAQIAALRVPGVKSFSVRLYDEVVDEITERFGQKAIRGINVKQHKQGGMDISLFLIMDYDINLMETAREVQKSVGDDLKMMFDIEDARIHIRVEGIHYEQGAT